MQTYLAPKWRIKGAEVLVESLNYSDYERDNPDTLNLKLAPNSQLPKFGDRLELFLGWEKLYFFGAFYVSAIKENYKKGFSVDATSLNHSKEIKEVKNRSFKNKSVGDILRAIARENGLKSKISFEHSSSVLSVLEQVDESDSALCARLAEEYGCSFGLKNDYLVFIDRNIKQYQRPRYQINADDCISLEIDYLVTKHFKSAEVVFMDKEGQEQTLIIGSGQQPKKRILTHASTKQEALIIGKTRLKEANTAKTKGSLRALGQVLFAGGLLELTKGKSKEIHLITQVQHSLDKSGWVMNLNFESAMNG
ncbi:contractile injection system protein, VgrG/Pvc8 family [Helicobacter sp. L8]|uniref:phage late control D family protein n=1 Tax=Helicobacter sp. L8 TaxID=2316078 RepID=UPI000EAE5F22|nr:contractile injection system protein, VgrG/Pvc8 family [Helicobacter sp. L8]